MTAGEYSFAAIDQSERQVRSDRDARLREFFLRRVRCSCREPLPCRRYLWTWCCRLCGLAIHPRLTIPIG
jgi:hypothetical protein